MSSSVVQTSDLSNYTICSLPQSRETIPLTKYHIKKYSELRYLRYERFPLTFVATLEKRNSTGQNLVKIYLKEGTYGTTDNMKEPDHGTGRMEYRN
jgi:hypothetical protein